MSNWISPASPVSSVYVGGVYRPASVTRHGNYPRTVLTIINYHHPPVSLSSLSLANIFYIASAVLLIFLKGLMINAWTLSLTQSLPQIYVLCLKLSRSPTQPFITLTTDLTLPTLVCFCSEASSPGILRGSLNLSGPLPLS